MPLPVAPRFALLALLPAPTLAVADASAPSAVTAGSMVQTLFSLLFVIALLVGTVWLIRKMSAGRGFGQGGLKTLGGLSLGPRERIVLVEIGDTWLVIGIVPGQIRTLHRMPKGELPTEMVSPLSDHPFAQKLKQMVEKQGNQRKDDHA